jgi:NAD(P)-dependent dehydrogenase (short-subunit alcohol dehydrogenase family)
MFSLAGKTTLLIGATAGLGLRVARAYVEAGAKVIIGGRRDEGGTVAADIGAHFVQVDVASEPSMSAAMDQVRAEHGAIDVLVNNAGVWPFARLEDIEPDTAQQILDVNLLGVVWGIKHGSRIMNDGGSIINTTALVTYRPHSRLGVYAASKAAVINLTRTAAIELGARGINVNCVNPTSVVGTEGNRDMDQEEVNLITNLTPLQRLGRMDDYVGIYNLLASDAGSFINAVDIPVDGGLLAGISEATLDILGKTPATPVDHCNESGGKSGEH